MPRNWQVKCFGQEKRDTSTGKEGGSRKLSLEIPPTNPRAYKRRSSFLYHQPVCPCKVTPDWSVSYWHCDSQPTAALWRSLVFHSLFLALENWPHHWIALCHSRRFQGHFSNMAKRMKKDWWYNDLDMSTAFFIDLFAIVQISKKCRLQEILLLPPWTSPDVQKTKRPATSDPHGLTSGRSPSLRPAMLKSTFRNFGVPPQICKYYVRRYTTIQKTPELMMTGYPRTCFCPWWWATNEASGHHWCSFFDVILAILSIAPSRNASKHKNQHPRHP